MEIRLAKKEIDTDSIVDGEGIRSVLWTQGCIHNCLGCHNPETHSFTEGILVNVDEIKKSISKLEAQDGITLSGGDPLCQAEACAEIASYCQSIGLNVWCYTGYTFEKVMELSVKNKYITKLLENIDVLVDGPFILEQKSLNIKFRGSSNQRIIDAKKSIKTKKVCLLEKYYDISKSKEKKKLMFL